MDTPFDVQRSDHMRRGGLSRPRPVLPKVDGGSDGGEQPALFDQGDRQCSIPALVEEHDHGVAVVALNRPLAPFRMRDARRDGEGLAHGLLCDAVPRIAVIAVAARTLEVLAEVAEEKGAPAGSALSVAAHHLDPRSVVLLPMLLRLGSFGRRTPEVPVPVETCDPSVR